MKRLLALLVLFAPITSAQLQRDHALDVSLRYVATEANAPPGRCGCFILQGAGLDASLPLTQHLRAVVDLAGVTTPRVPASQRGLSEITLLAGPRYTLRLDRTRLNGQALFGAVRGFDSVFTVTPTTKADTSTNFAIAFGGSLDVPVTSALRLRAVQLEYLQTNLPNGADNRQRNLRISTGLAFRFHLPASR